MKRRILTVMLAGVLALQGSVWTAAAEEEILLVEESGGTDLIDEDDPAAEENVADFEGKEISEEDFTAEGGAGSKEENPGTAEATIEELDVVKDPGYVQVQEEAVAAEAGDVAVNAENFPDEVFREYIINWVDEDGNGILESGEIEAVTDIYLPAGIKELKGIEFFKSLTRLECSENSLSSLDVSGNPSLTELRCGSNQLSSLDVSGNPSLTELWCESNQLSSLDVSHNPALETLYCNGNQLSSLDVSHNPALEILECYGNQLSSLDLSGNPSLRYLDCSDNPLGSLDISRNPSLNGLCCDNNQLSSLDVSGAPSLGLLSCTHNQLSSLDLSGNPHLGEIWLGGHTLGGHTLQVPAPVQVDGIWQMNLADYVGAGNLDRVTIVSEGASLSGETVLFGSIRPTELIYEYDTRLPLFDKKSDRQIEVIMKFPDNVECDEHHMVTVADREATCGTPGSQHRECTVCGYKENSTEIPATGAHSFGAYVITKAATVLEEGTQTRKCSVCGKTESAPLAKLTPQMVVSGEKVTLKTGQTTKLEVSGLAEGDSVVSWESSNKKVVKVDGEGKLTAQKKTGTAVVTITLASGLEKEIQVTVQKTKVETKKISGLPKTVTLKKGKKLTLKPVITPADSQDKVTYKSLNKKVATVSGKGVVKGKKAGKAKITVTSGKRKVTVTVKVKK